ncbi:hypothetical protein EEF76_10620, partial [Neisseria gonorrhoeae]
MSGNQRAVATEPSFPRRRESRPVRTETYRLKGFSRFRILDSRLRGNDGFRDCGVVGDDGSGILLRPPRACKRRARQKCRLKVQTASES